MSEPSQRSAYTFAGRYMTHMALRGDINGIEPLLMRTISHGMRRWPADTEPAVVAWIHLVAAGLPAKGNP